MNGDQLYALMHTLLDCARHELDQCEAPLTRTYVTSGVIVWDNCCDDGGQLVITTSRVYQSDQFPATTVTPLVCDTTIVGVDLEIQIVRCAPTYDDRGDPPSVTVLNESAILVLNDAAAVKRGVKCCLLEMLETREEIEEAIVVEQRFVGPEGGCVGSSLYVSIGMLEGCDCG